MTSLPQTRQRFALWTTLVILLLPTLALLIWAGSASDPRRAPPWNWTQTGWIVPAPGLASLWIASALLFLLLSAIAWLLFYPVPAAITLKPWVSAAIIVLLALAVRIAIACTWIPLPLNPLLITAETLAMPGPLRGWAIAVDMTVLLLLLLTLRGADRSLWWAAIYALHPLPLIAIAGNGHWVSFAIIPLALAVALSHHLARPARLAICGLVALAAVATVAATASLSPFNSLAAEVLATMAIPNHAVLPSLAALLQAIVLVLAVRRDWPLARILGHLYLVFLLCSPMVQPWQVVPLLALLPVSWSRAAWVLSLLVLAAYAAVPIVRAKEPWHLPLWLLMLEWMPVIVLEAQELLAETLSPAENSTVESSTSVAARTDVR